MLGFVCDIGGCIFYILIMVCLFEFLVIVGINDIIKKVKNGDMFVFDVMNNKIIINFLEV